MIRKPFRAIRRLTGGGNSGATMVEFALIAPVFFLAMMGLIELGLIFFTHSVLQGALAHGARIGLTGHAGGGDRQTFILQEIENFTGGYLDESRMTVETLSYKSFSGIGEPEPCILPPSPPCPGVPGVNFQDINGNGTWDEDQGRADAGGANDIVLYTVKYHWKLFTPMMAQLIGNDAGEHDIMASAVVKNEMFR